MLAQKTYAQKSSEVDRRWVVLDAENVVLGRLSAYIAHLLQGKHKSVYTPHVDGGDCVIVINADKVMLTGKKFDDKIYYRHTGYPGGIKKTTPKRLLEKGQGDRIVKSAVWGMIRHDGPMGRRRMKNLYVYRGVKHLHEGQKPEVIDFISFSRKNNSNAKSKMK